MSTVATELRFTRAAYNGLFERLEPHYVEHVIDLAHELAGDLPDLVARMPDSDTFVARFGYVTFVCCKSHKDASIWRILRIFIGDPHDTPPGGGLGAVQLREDSGAAIQFGLPTGYAWLNALSHDAPASNPVRQSAWTLRTTPSSGDVRQPICTQGRAVYERTKDQSKSILHNAGWVTPTAFHQTQMQDLERANSNAANEIKSSAFQDKRESRRPDDTWPQTLPRPDTGFLWEQVDYWL